MLTDHIGYVFFPGMAVFRIIGRLAFPIFAYSIYEGCKYTRNKPRYLLRVFALGFICLAGYYIYDRSLFFNVVISFSVAIVIIYGLQGFKKQLASHKKSAPKLLSYALWTGASIAGAYFFCKFSDVDYGFWGVMLPVFAELADISAFTAGKDTKLGRYEKYIACAGFAAGLLLLSADLGGRQYFSLFALLPILLTGDKRGKLNLKYFFYIFYPLHLLVIEGIAYLISLK